MTEWYLERYQERELQVSLAKVGYELSVKEYGTKLTNATSVEEGKRLIAELNKLVNAYNAMVESRDSALEDYRKSAGGNQ